MQYINAPNIILGIMNPLDSDDTKNQVILILKYYLYKCRCLGVLSCFHILFWVICLFLKKSRDRYKYKNIWHAYTILHGQSTFNLSKQTFCNTTLGLIHVLWKYSYICFQWYYEEDLWYLKLVSYGVYFFFIDKADWKYKKSRGRYKYKNIWHVYTILHRQSTFNLSKQTFCNTTLKFHSPRTVSNGNHFYIPFV
jgi:hypothetical protein